MVLARRTLFQTEVSVAHSEQATLGSGKIIPTDARENTVKITASALTKPPNRLKPMSPAAPKNLCSCSCYGEYGSESRERF